jgi:tripartite-type tricarboxylate transporter receptor subunit TctC
MAMNRCLGLHALLALVGCLLAPLAAAAQDFYAGKQVKLVVGGGVGGGTDLYGRFLARHLGAHIPGKPTLYVVNMPGADSITAGNYAANLAPHDGTELFALGQSLPMVQGLGKDSIKFDLAAFGWIGNMSESVNVFIAWHQSPVRTLEDAKRHALTIGSTTAGSLSGLMPVVLNNLLGTKFRVINGYDSGGAIELAMERGEIGGRASVTWASLKAERPDWVRDHAINVLVQVGLTPDRELPGVPMLDALGKKPADAAVLRFFAELSAVARTFCAAPGLPPARLTLLRRAFDATMRDPAVLAEAGKLQLDISPMTGEALQTVVTNMVRTPADLVSQIKKSFKE